MAGCILGITFNVNSQVLVDSYMGNSGFRLSFKAKLTECSHHLFRTQSCSPNSKEKPGPCRNYVLTSSTGTPGSNLLALQTQTRLLRTAQM